jgi:hypothetical protein
MTARNSALLRVLHLRNFAVIPVLPLYAGTESMAGMSHSSDHDPATQNRYGPDRFNVAWLKDGEKLTSFQRIGFGVFSLFLLFAGVFFGAAAFNAIREGHVLGARAAGAFLP